MRLKTIELDGMAWLRVFSACQGLMSPTGFYGATHKRCREIIKAELGFCPKGKPGTPGKFKFRNGGTDAIHEWLGFMPIEHVRAYDMGVTCGYVTILGEMA